MAEFVNLATLPPEQQKAIQRDNIAALWAWQVKHGKASPNEIERRILKLKDPEKIKDMRARYDRFRKVKTPWDPKPEAKKKPESANNTSANKRAETPEPPRAGIFRQIAEDNRPAWLR